MTPEQFKEINQTIKETVSEQITLVVNGKINRLQNDFNDFKENDEAWKKEVGPALKMFNETSVIVNFAIIIIKIMAWIGGGIISLIFLYMAIKNFNSGN